MASSSKIIVLCICLMLVSFGVIVDAGQGMMGGMLGGGGGKHGGHGGLETLLAAGLLAKLLRGNSGGHGGYGGYGRSAHGVEAQAIPYHAQMALAHGYGGY